MSAERKEMVQFAKAWARGNKVFKTLWETKAEDKALIIVKKDVWEKGDLESKKLQNLARSCESEAVEEYMKVAIPRHAVMAKYSLIYCLGKKILEEEEQKNP